MGNYKYDGKEFNSEKEVIEYLRLKEGIGIEIMNKQLDMWLSDFSSIIEGKKIRGYKGDYSQDKPYIVDISMKHLNKYKLDVGVLLLSNHHQVYEEGEEYEYNYGLVALNEIILNQKLHSIVKYIEELDKKLKGMYGERTLNKLDVRIEITGDEELTVIVRDAIGDGYGKRYKSKLDDVYTKDLRSLVESTIGGTIIKAIEGELNYHQDDETSDIFEDIVIGTYVMDNWLKENKGKRVRIILLDE